MGQVQLHDDDRGNRHPRRLREVRKADARTWTRPRTSTRWRGRVHPDKQAPHQHGTRFNAVVAALAVASRDGTGLQRGRRHQSAQLSRTQPRATPTQATASCSTTTRWSRSCPRR